MRSLGRVGAAATLFVAGCVSASSGSSATVVFESVTHEVLSCPEEVPDGTDCLTVTATVVGTGVGSGSCVVYAAGEDGNNIAASAASPTWELRPGATIQWQVQVSRPAAPDVREWNPHCEPMIEG